MKRVYKSAQEPESLRIYREHYPHETWEHFRRRTSTGYKDVKQQLLADQHGLCAYCEISIKMAEKDGEIDDFRVEHFYPKSATNLKSGHNFHLDWRNMLGVCHGGSQPEVAGAKERYTARKDDRTCDVPKGDKMISKLILNPLKIPARIRLFKYVEHDGTMLVDETTCPKDLQEKAQTTIRELNLNAPRLRRMRLAVMQQLEEQIAQELAEGQPIRDVMDLMAATCMVPDFDGNLLPFFSVIRWYLGSAAEHVIRTSGKKL